MNNQLLAKVLFTNGLATKDQIQQYWALATDSKDIAAVLRDQGVMTPEVYTQVMNFVSQMDGMNAPNVPEPAPAPAPAPVAPIVAAPPVVPEPPQPKSPEPARPFGLAKAGAERPSIRIESNSAPLSAKVEPEVSIAPGEFAIEGNNPFGEGYIEESSEEVRSIEGLQDTRIFDFRTSTPTVAPVTPSVKEVQVVNANPVSSGIPPKDWICHFGDGTPRSAAAMVPGPQSKLDALLLYARKQGLSDLFLSTGNAIWGKIGSSLQSVSDAPCSQADMRRLLNEAFGFVPANLGLDRSKNLRLGLSVPGAGRFRLVITWTTEGPSLAFHVIPHKLPNWQELGIPEFCREWPQWRQGLILLGGTTGSGCSTTARWLAEEAQQARACLVQVVSEPIEAIWGNNTLSFFFEPGLHAASKAQLLRDCIQRGDGILIAEDVRTVEELMLVMEAAESGILVIATMEANDILDLLSRFVARFEEKDRSMARALLARALHGISCQKLVLSEVHQKPMAAFDALTSNHSIANLIRKNEFGQIRTLMAGMKPHAISMDESLRKLGRGA